MSIPTRTSVPGTYFVTTATQARRRVFQVTKNAQLLLQVIQQYRAEGFYKLHAFVVMPDHVHILLTPQHITLQRAVGLIKGGFSHRLAAMTTPWQRGFTDHRIRNREEFVIRRNYIHLNPVRAGLVQAAEEYPYSSAYVAEKDTDLSG